MSVWAVLLVALWSSLARAADGSESVPVLDLTMSQCIDIAIHQATAVLTGTNEYELSGTQILKGYGKFLPDLNVGASYSYQSGTTLYTITGLDSVQLKGQMASTSVTSSLNLFNGLGDYSSLRSALSRRKYYDLSLEWARHQVALDIVQTFYQLTLDEQLLDIAKKNLAASVARLKLIEGQSKVGASSQADLYRQRAETSADSFSVAQYEGRARDDEVLLVRKLRLDPEKSYRFLPPDLKPAEKPRGSGPLGELVSLGLENRLDLRSNQEQLEATGWDTKTAEAGYLPRLDLNFVRSSNATHVLSSLVNGAPLPLPEQQGIWAQLGDQVQYSVTLSLTWNLFDHFNTRLAVDRARTIRDNADIATQDSKLQVEADVRTAVSDWNTAEKQLTSAQAGLEAADKSYQAVEGMYEVGSASIVDVLTSQAALVQARSNQAQALVMLKLQEKTVDYAVGELVSDK